MGRGGFSFKIAFDETMSRFSPGVLIEIDNLRRVLNRDDLDWMDSCAAADHPMIDSLWGERRQIVQYRVALRGVGRSIAWTARSEEHTSEHQSLMRISYAVFCLKQKTDHVIR